MDTLIKPLSRFLSSLRKFTTDEIWRLDLSRISRLRAFFIQQVRVGYLVARAFVQDRLLVRASALVYATLLSIVPLLAVMFSLLKGFGFHNKIEPVLNKALDPLGAQAKEVIIPTIVQFVENVSVGALGAAGLLLLLISVFSIINNIERAFNDIWKVKNTRSLKRRFSDYLSVLLIGPVFLFAVLGLTASLQSNTFVQSFTQHPWFRFLFNKTAPFVTTWIAFYFLLVFVPNTKVQFVHALKGAVVTGTLWQVANWFFARFIVTSYQTGAKAALYAGFATLPLFLVWLFISWAIVLLGAEISYANQNVDRFRWSEKGGRFSPRYRQSMLVKFILFTAQKYHLGERPASSVDFANAFSVPESAVNDLVNQLVEQDILLTTEADGIVHYVPAQSVSSVKVIDVLKKLRNYGLSGDESKHHEQVELLVQQIENDLDLSMANVLGESTFFDLINRLPAPAKK